MARRHYGDDRLLRTAMALRQALSPLIERDAGITSTDVIRAARRLYQQGNRDIIQASSEPYLNEMADLICSM
jgi:hypothetical protein